MQRSQPARGLPFWVSILFLRLIHSDLAASVLIWKYSDAKLCKGFDPRSSPSRDKKSFTSLARHNREANFSISCGVLGFLPCLIPREPTSTSRPSFWFQLKDIPHGGIFFGWVAVLSSSGGSSCFLFCPERHFVSRVLAITAAFPDSYILRTMWTVGIWGFQDGRWSFCCSHTFRTRSGIALSNALCCSRCSVLGSFWSSSFWG